MHKSYKSFKIGFHDCNFFNEEKLGKICEQEGIVDKFDFILISMTLHHLRAKVCVAKKRDPKHRCTEDENCARWVNSTPWEEKRKSEAKLLHKRNLAMQDRVLACEIVKL